MIPAEVVRQIRTLLRADTLSQRKIAERLGVSRGTVNSIARGKRSDHAARPNNHADDFIPPAGLPRRCPGCGGMVQMPCLACLVRAIKARRQRAG